MNNLSVRNFTNALYELLCVKKIELVPSLEIISQKDFATVDKKVRNAALEILKYMEDGLSFSSALAECRNIRFDFNYINFFSYSEITGNIYDSIIFLKKRCDEETENINCIVTACIYPAFVIFLGILLCGYFMTYGKTLFLKNGIQVSSLQEFSLVKCILIFIVLTVCSFIFILKNLEEDKKYEAFLVVSFFLKSGMSMKGAFSYAALILGEHSREGKLFLQAKERLSLGMDLRSAFNSDEQLRKIEIPGFEMAMYFAQKGGSKSDVFEKIALSIKERDFKKRKICLSLIEPLFISLTGVFLLMLVINFVMPVVLNTGIIL